QPSPIHKKRYTFVRCETSLIKPAPHPLDDTIASLCRKFVRSRQAQRQTLRASLSMDDFYTLLTFAHRAAVFALRDRGAVGVAAGRRCAVGVADGLTGVAMIEAERVD